MAGGDTRARLLHAAETLFAQRSFSDVGLRDIAEEAGDAVSSITYHFGTRERLIEAVVARHFTPINNERLTLLTACIAQDAAHAPSLRTLLDAFLRPPIIGHDAHVAHMLPIIAQCFTTMQHVAAEQKADFHVMLSAFLPRMRQQCVHLTDEEYVVRFHFVIGMLVRCLQSIHQPLASTNIPDASERAHVLQQLIHGAEAVFSAPSLPDHVPTLNHPMLQLILTIIRKAAGDSHAL